MVDSFGGFVQSKLYRRFLGVATVRSGGGGGGGGGGGDIITMVLRNFIVFQYLGNR